MAKSSRPAKTAQEQEHRTEQPDDRERSGRARRVRRRRHRRREGGGNAGRWRPRFPSIRTRRPSTIPTRRSRLPKGASVKPADPIVGASTVSERQRIRQGRQRWAEHRPESDGRSARSRARRFDRPRAHDQPGRPDRRQSELAEGRAARPDAARGLHPSREDHPLRPRAHPRADRACARLGGARLLRMHQGDPRVHARLALRRGRQADAGLRPLLDRARRARLDRHGARRPRLRGEVLHGRGQLGSRRQQHPGLLHPGRDEVPRPGPRRQARAALRDAAGGVGARHVLGLRVADARDHPHADVGDVRPRHPAQLSDDAGLRRAHLPPGQRPGRVALRQVPLESEGRHPFARLGRGGQDLRRRLRLPSPRSVGGDRGRRLSRSGNWACRSSPKNRRRASPSTCSTRRRSSPRSWCRSFRSAGWS